MAISDPKMWNELHQQCREINQRVKEMQQFALDNGLVLVDQGGTDDIFMRAYGRGLKDTTTFDSRTDAAIPGPFVEAWQESTGCNEQGSSTFPWSYAGRVLTDVPGEKKPANWDESASHWEEN